MEEIENNRLIKLARLYERYLKSEIDYTISDKDAMNDVYYKAVGVSAATVVYNACAISSVPDVRSILDVPSGHGRVLRHLVKLFPDAQFDACDLDADAIRFCAAQFGARPILSKERFEEVEFGKTYELIWVGSFFTHLNRTRAFAALKHLTRFLAHDGIIVATFHGRVSARNGKALSYTNEELWKKILKECNKTGYGYRDYPKGMSHYYIAGSYGVSLSSAAVVISEAQRIPEVTVVSYTEHGWSGHQDVLVLGRREIPEFQL